MLIPKQIGGEDKEDEKKRPGLLVALSIAPKKPKVPTRIGGDDTDEPVDDNSDWTTEAKQKAMKMFVSELGRPAPSIDKLVSTLEAFWQACEASPHEEYEDQDEEEKEQP